MCGNKRGNCLRLIMKLQIEIFVDEVFWEEIVRPILIREERDIQVLG